jgi:hypothetical protein
MSILKLSEKIADDVKYAIAILLILSSSRAAMLTVRIVSGLPSNNLVNPLSAASQSTLFLMDTSRGAKCPLGMD